MAIKIPTRIQPVKRIKAKAAVKKKVAAKAKRTVDPLMKLKKPSQLIRVALADLEQVEASDKYKVNMEVWHVPNGKCSVCLGGAVLAMTYAMSPKKHLNPWRCGISARAADRIGALNAIRRGGIAPFLRGFYGQKSNRNAKLVADLDKLQPELTDSVRAWPDSLRVEMLNQEPHNKKQRAALKTDLGAIATAMESVGL